jgi:phage baseplate assembly protein V
MFDAYLSQRLGPLVERLAELEAEIEDLRRRAEGHNRIGTVSAVNPAQGLCQVSHGELKSPWIKYFNPAAGEVSETRHPSVGEQCLLLNFGGGDGSAQAFALLGVPSAAFPVASTTAPVHRRTYPDGTETSYDHAAHKLTWIIGPTTIIADHAHLELVSNGTRLLLNAAQGLLSSNGSSTTVDAAGVHFAGPRVDHDGVNIGLDHVHKDTMPNPGTDSGTPK